jgi:hypothetical protein
MAGQERLLSRRSLPRSCGDTNQGRETYVKHLYYPIGKAPEHIAFRLFELILLSEGKDIRGSGLSRKLILDTSRAGSGPNPPSAASSWTCLTPVPALAFQAARSFRVLIRKKPSRRTARPTGSAFESMAIALLALTGHHGA